jgi:hypothetical protein
MVHPGNRREGDYCWDFWKLSSHFEQVSFSWLVFEVRADSLDFLQSSGVTPSVWHTRSARRWQSFLAQPAVTDIPMIIAATSMATRMQKPPPMDETRGRADIVSQVAGGVNGGWDHDSAGKRIRPRRVTAVRAVLA